MPHPDFMPHRRTIEAHPLIRRLSGQVIWCMFEEAGADPRHIQAFLDGYESCKAKVLADLEKALDPEGGVAAIRIDVPRGRVECKKCASCRACQNLDGRIIPASDHAVVAAFFPPYALGCPARAMLLGRDELVSRPQKELRTVQQFGSDTRAGHKSGSSAAGGVSEPKTAFFNEAVLHKMRQANFVDITLNAPPSPAPPLESSPHGELICGDWIFSHPWGE